jgi:hypothetical protein
VSQHSCYLPKAVKTLEGSKQTGDIEPSAWSDSCFLAKTWLCVPIQLQAGTSPAPAFPVSVTLNLVLAAKSLYAGALEDKKG